VDLDHHVWSAHWCQIDQFGAVEKVSLRGEIAAGGSSDLPPLKLRSVTTESLRDSGTIDPKFLRWNIWFDPFSA
jgi:hypothetical protein